MSYEKKSFLHLIHSYFVSSHLHGIIHPKEVIWMRKIHSMSELYEAISGELVVLIVKTHRCSVCTAVSPRLDQLVQRFPHVSSYEVYIDDLPEFAGQHLVFSVPTVLCFTRSKEILRESRFINFQTIERLLDIHSS